MNRNKLKSYVQKNTTRLIAAAVMAVVSISASAETPAPKEDMAALQQLMQSQIGMMTPEMQKNVKGLSKENKSALIKIYSQHTRRSDQVTLRQVMHEVLSDYHSITAGLLTDNAEQAAEAARRLANHRLPRGGLLPYLKLEQVNDQMVSALVPFNDSVEGNAIRLAEAADEGDLVKAASYLDKVTNGCISCHAVFRGVPGKTPFLK